MKNMGKREKFLLSFFIAVVILLIVLYISSIQIYNFTLEEYNIRKLNISIQDGAEYVKTYFLDTYNVDINSNPGMILFAMMLNSAETVAERMISFILLTISLTTIVYLILSIKIKSFSEYWKELFKAFLILLLVSIIIYIFNVINYEYLIKTIYDIAVEYSMFSILFVAVFEWFIVVIGSLVINCKSLKFKRVKEVEG